MDKLNYDGQGKTEAEEVEGSLAVAAVTVILFCCVVVLAMLSGAAIALHWALNWIRG